MTRKTYNIFGYIILALLLGGSFSDITVAGPLNDTSNKRRCRPVKVDEGIYDIPIYCGGSTNSDGSNTKDCTTEGLAPPPTEVSYHNGYYDSYGNTAYYGPLIIQGQGSASRRTMDWSKRRGDPGSSSIPAGTVGSAPGNQQYVTAWRNHYYLTNVAKDVIVPLDDVCYFYSEGPSNLNAIEKNCAGGGVGCSANYWSHDHIWYDVNNPGYYPTTWMTTKYAVRMDMTALMRNSGAAGGSYNGGSDEPWRDPKGFYVDFQYNFCLSHNKTSFACSTEVPDRKSIHIDPGSATHLPQCNGFKKTDEVTLSATDDDIYLDEVCFVPQGANISLTNGGGSWTKDSNVACFYASYLSFKKLGGSVLNSYATNGYDDLGYSYNMSNNVNYSVVGVWRKEWGNTKGAKPTGTSTTEDIYGSTPFVYYLYNFGNACFQLQDEDTTPPTISNLVVTGRPAKNINGYCRYYAGTNGFNATFDLEDTQSGLPYRDGEYYYMPVYYEPWNSYLPEITTSPIQAILGNTASGGPILGDGCFCRSHHDNIAYGDSSYDIITYGNLSIDNYSRDNGNTHNGSCEVYGIPSGPGYKLISCGATDINGNLGTTTIGIGESATSTFQCSYGNGICHRGPYYGSSYTANTHAPINLCTNSSASTPIETTTGWNWTCAGDLQTQSCSVTKDVACGIGAGKIYLDGDVFPSGTSACAGGTISGYTITSTGLSWNCLAGITKIPCSATRFCDSKTIPSLFTGLCLVAKGNQLLKSTLSNNQRGYSSTLMSNALSYQVDVTITPPENIDGYYHAANNSTGRYGYGISYPTVNEWGYCFTPEHQKTKDVFIPTRTKAEIDKFVSAATGNNIQLNGCAKYFACTGTLTSGMILYQDWFSGIDSGAFRYAATLPTGTGLYCSYHCKSGRGYDLYSNTCAQERTIPSSTGGADTIQVRSGNIWFTLVCNNNGKKDGLEQGIDCGTRECGVCMDTEWMQMNQNKYRYDISSPWYGYDIGASDIIATGKIVYTMYSPGEAVLGSDYFTKPGTVIVGYERSKDEYHKKEMFRQALYTSSYYPNKGGLGDWQCSTYGPIIGLSCYTPQEVTACHNTEDLIGSAISIGSNAKFNVIGLSQTDHTPSNDPAESSYQNINLKAIGYNSKMPLFNAKAFSDNSRTYTEQGYSYFHYGSEKVCKNYDDTLTYSSLIGYGALDGSNRDPVFSCNTADNAACRTIIQNNFDSPSDYMAYSMDVDKDYTISSWNRMGAASSNQTANQTIITTDGNPSCALQSGTYNVGSITFPNLIVYTKPRLAVYTNGFFVASSSGSQSISKYTMLVSNDTCTHIVTYNKAALQLSTNEYIQDMSIWSGKLFVLTTNTIRVYTLGASSLSYLTSISLPDTTGLYGKGNFNRISVSDYVIAIVGYGTSANHPEDEMSPWTYRNPYTN